MTLEDEINAAFKEISYCEDQIRLCVRLLGDVHESASRESLYSEIQRYTEKRDNARLEIERIKLVIEARKVELTTGTGPREQDKE